MSTVEKISVSITSDMAEDLKAAVTSGEFGSTSEAIRDAIRLWTARREREEAELTYLRQAWQDGVDSDPGKLASIQDIISKARSQFDSQK